MPSRTSQSESASARRGRFAQVGARGLRPWPRRKAHGAGPFAPQRLAAPSWEVRKAAGRPGAGRGLRSWQPSRRDSPRTAFRLAGALFPGCFAASRARPSDMRKPACRTPRARVRMREGPSTKPPTVPSTDGACRTGPTGGNCVRCRSRQRAPDTFRQCPGSCPSSRPPTYGNWS